VPNPNINLGTLNRLVASVIWPRFTQLNVTAAFLGKAGIRFARNGNATTFLPQMTGVVTSSEPYIAFTMTLSLIKTQSLVAAYEAQLQQQSVLGNGTVRPDVTSGLQPFDIYNCGIETPGELDFSGQSAEYPITIGGFLPINNALWP
jgi:hypothetical protein